jgi:hypothetical protein
MMDLVAETPTRKGRYPRVDMANNLDRFANWARRRSMVQGPRFFCTWEQLIIGCGYGDRGDYEANLRHGLTSAQRYVALFQEAGLMAVEGRHGKGGGLWVELLDPRVHSGSRARSSAGSSVGRSRVRCELERARESRQERHSRRARPHRRCKDAPRRIERVSFFPLSDLGSSVGAPTPLKGVGAKEQLDDARVRASRDEGSAEDRRCWVEGGVPTAVGLRLAALVADAREIPSLAPSRGWAAFFELFGPSGPISHSQRQRLARILRRLDRYASHGQGSPGAGLELLVELMVGHRRALLWEDRLPRPATLAYFLPELDRTSKKWRRDNDPDRRRRSEEWRRRRGMNFEAQGRELRPSRKGRRR